MSAAGDAQVVPFTVSLEQFLKAAFAARWGEALITYFLGSPDPKSGNPLINWTSYPAASVLHVLRPEMNLYFDVSLPAGGTRQVTDFGSLHVIVLDDYETKVDPAKIEFLLGCPPSYVIETSPGNFQAGWFIEPLNDLAWANGLLKLLYEAMGQTGDNLKKPTTLVRLPGGTNNKAALGPGGFKVRLVRWRPRQRIWHTDWINVETRIGTVLPVMPVMPPTGRGNKIMPAPEEIEKDPIMRIFREQGMVLDSGSWRAFGWAYAVQCPQAARHTDGRVEAHYVPVHQRFKCHHHSCEGFGRTEVRRWADSWLMLNGEVCVAGHEFEDYVAEEISPGDALDQWDEEAVSAWPGQVYTLIAETEAAMCAAHNGFDHAGLGAALLGAGAAAADKRITLRPYRGIPWTTPPIVWVMLIGNSGSRKTAIWETVLAGLQHAHDAAMTRWVSAQAHYRAQPLLYRQINPPPEMLPLLVNDATVEAVQAALSQTPRGVAYLRDELSAVLDFDRYAQIAGGGQAGRAFYLESYEAKPFTLIRVKRGGLHLKNSGLTIGGGIQPHLVSDYLQHTGDGLMQRFIKVKLGGPEARKLIAGGLPYPGIPEVDAMLERLRMHVPQQEYTTTPEGEAMIRVTEADGRNLAATTSLGPAFAAEASKMHGLHARVALILHLMDAPDEYVVSDDAVRRARRFVDYAMATSAHVYAEQGPRAIARAIGSWLLRNQPVKATARDLQRNIAICRGKSAKELNEMIEPLVTGGWVKPFEPYPTNRVWWVNPRLQEQFSDRLAAEIARVEAEKRSMNYRGQYEN